MLRSLCLAGSFKVQDLSVQDKNALVLMVRREPIEDHLHECRSFILEWTTRSKRPTNTMILQELRRVDMHIRKKWWSLFSKNQPNGRTLTSCVLETQFYADQQWSHNFAVDLFPDGVEPWVAQEGEEEEEEVDDGWEEAEDEEGAEYGESEADEESVEGAEYGEEEEVDEESEEGDGEEIESEKEE